MNSSIDWKDSELLSPSHLEKLSRFADLLLHWNSRINLTGYRKKEEINQLLIGESVIAAEVLWRLKYLTQGKKVLDFGSGAGIPGLIWAVLGVGLEITSLEIRQKKAAFQKEVVRELDLSARVIPGRFPDDVLGSQFDLIVSRAIRFDSNVWDAGKACLAPKGSFVRFATAGVEDPGWKSIPTSEKSSLLVQTI